MKIRGPLVTLAAVAVLGAARVLGVNTSKEEPAPQANPYSQATTTAAAASSHSSAARAEHAAATGVPGTGRLVGKIPTANGTITLEITVQGDKAVAYACDGNTVESWLRGSAVNGAVRPSQTRTRRAGSKDTSRGMRSSAPCGSVKRNGTCNAPVRSRPRGSDVSDNAGVHGQLGWSDPNGGVTGVQRREDGSTAPSRPSHQPTASPTSKRHRGRSGSCAGGQRCLIRPPRSKSAPPERCRGADCRHPRCGGRRRSRRVRESA